MERRIVGVLVGMGMLLPVAAWAQQASCEERLAVTQKYTQSLEAQRFQAAVQLAQEQVRNDQLAESLKAEQAKSAQKTPENKK